MGWFIGVPMVLAKAVALTGLKVGDSVASGYTWRDIEGEIRPDPAGANTPLLIDFRTGVRAYHYSTNDKADLAYHIPHDYVPGTDLHLHVHWGHNGTAISGNLVLDYVVSYAKGHNQANFSTPVSITQTVATPDVATVPQYRHRIDEFQLSASSPSASQIDTDDIEPDGILLVSVTATTIPTVTAGDPFIFTWDLHYMSHNLGTAQKAPNFYA